MPQRTVQGLLADTAAGVSGAGAVASWLATANDVLQLFATGVAIVAGVYAIRWHKVRIDKVKKEQSNDKQSE